MNKKLLNIFLLFILSTNISAQELGVIGNVWKIKERNLIEVMKERLSQKFNNQTEEEIQKELQQQVEEKALRPDPVVGIIKAKETRIRYFDPSFTLTKDISDNNGVVFARKGQVINPFDITNFTQTLIFIDADDMEQINWVRSFQPKTLRSKVILVNGNIRDTEILLDKQIFFDQMGELTERFDIRKVPTIIEQANGEKKLKITEVGL
ncbi:type-F conjugative transfer system protein TraW [Proteus sp. fly-1013]|uniref:type-F conjugative transfer system protein TraW n=1 Tax=Proteus sp. fly-1013 TaxID=3136673 RepID=UPI0032DB0660